MIPGSGKWIPWNGAYEKRTYIVKDKNGLLWECWPNAGKMCAVDGSGKEFPFHDKIQIWSSEVPADIEDLLAAIKAAEVVAEGDGTFYRPMIQTKWIDKLERWLREKEERG